MALEDNVRFIVGGAIAGLGIFVIGLQAVRGTLDPQLLQLEMELFLIAATFVLGGGLAGKLLPQILGSLD